MIVDQNMRSSLTLSTQYYKGKHYGNELSIEYHYEYTYILYIYVYEKLFSFFVC